MDFKLLREEVWSVNVQLPKAGVVTMHSGNASGIDRHTGLVLIKPSGIDYDQLRPEDLSVVDLSGSPVTPDQVPDDISSQLVARWPLTLRTHPGKIVEAEMRCNSS